MIDKFKNINKKIKIIRNKYLLRRFYLESHNKGKFYGAIILDSIFINIILLIAFTIILYRFTYDIMFSFIIAIQFFLVYLLMMNKIRKIKIRNSIRVTNDKIGQEEILKYLQNKNPYDFTEYVEKILKKCNIKYLENAKHKDIDLVGHYNDNKIGIKCFQYNESYKVGTNDLKIFFLNLRELQLNEGIIITTSSFDNDVNEFLIKTENYAKINLIDKDKFIKILKKTSEYLSEKEIQKIILNRIHDKKKNLKELGKKSLLKGKFSRYFITGIMLMVLGRMTPFKFYYSIIGYVLLSFSILSIIINVHSLLKSKTIQNEEIL